MVATGAADGSLRVWDRRKLTGSSTHKGAAAVKVFKQHTEAIMRIEWHPSEKTVLASGGDDHLVLVWDLSRSSIRDDTTTPAKSGSESGAAKAEGAAGGSKGAKGAPPPELLFKHVGHRQGVRALRPVY
ncbi:wd-repeat protein [Monoraphidium neglectum]|uniref:Wd-repeat protein n=1 Tax=Monoraphidium neglectum TaxID=145388 RepID=A0A0D2M8U1_9CHLO|nr:wd-repeat protein [Monoraphidium neglectum]KIY91880.1 wd-repeat protein [Monoraphidium neglectum]|eukprot:XP_013890900.1 wd-repeat protein [Monoraphidium neglectum]